MVSFCQHLQMLTANPTYGWPNKVRCITEIELNNIQKRHHLIFIFLSIEPITLIKKDFLIRLMVKVFHVFFSPKEIHRFFTLTKFITPLHCLIISVQQLVVVARGCTLVHYRLYSVQPIIVIEQNLISLLIVP